MKALITGGCGFIGSHLAEKLLARGDSVFVVDDLSTGRFENIAHLRGHELFGFAIEDIAHENVMDRLISECDVVFHLAAAVGVELIVKDPVHVIETNVKGCETVLRIAARYRKKVMLASTSEVYGKSTEVPFLEDADRVLGPTTKSRWSYACSKAMDEFLALAYAKQVGLPVVIMRFFNTVGPRQTGRYGMVMPRFVRQALMGQPITVYGDGQQSRCFCHVGDVTNAILLLADEPTAEGQVFNVGSTEEVTILQLAEHVRQQCQANVDIVLVPYDQAYEEGFEDMRRRVPSIEKIDRYVGWQPRFTLAETISAVIDHMKHDMAQ